MKKNKIQKEMLASVEETLILPSFYTSKRPLLKVELEVKIKLEVK